MMFRNTLSALAMAAFYVASPAVAQDAGSSNVPEPKINTIYIFGDDECPESTDDVITVCGILVEADRYRIPEGLRDDPNDPTKDSWAARVQAYRYVGKEGSCSSNGNGGFDGCGLRQIEAAYEEKDQDPGKLFGRLIAEKRAERLAEIDAESQEIEERVKKFEEERLQREAKEAEARRQMDAADAQGMQNPDDEPLPLPN